MARPIKDNADYFPHEKHLRDKPEMHYIRKKFGEGGFGIVIMLLEYLTDKENFRCTFNENEKKLLSINFWVEIELINQIIEDCIKIGFFVKVTIRDEFECPYLNAQMTALISKRLNMRKLREEKIKLEIEQKNKELGQNYPIDD